MGSFDSVAPVLPVADVGTALATYAQLGFAVHRYDGDAAYGYARRGGIALHLSEVAGLDPLTSLVSAYLYVDDADAVYAEWLDAGTGGRLVAPTDTDYGLREGGYVDPDGNLLRFGSPL